MANHDQSYKYLFSHAAMVADLLRGFVREEWVAGLDMSTLERVNGSYISDDLRERADDIVWRVRWGEEWLYVYILLEFQSTVDRWMAVRMLTYVGLLYQDLIRTGQTRNPGKLPPVLPLVLYNGNQAWNAATNICDLIYQVPGGLARYSPSMQYLLLAEHDYDDDDLRGLNNLAAALFRLENSKTPADLLEVIRQLLQWLGNDQQASLRRAFTVWFSTVLFPAKNNGEKPPAIEELQEVETMLAERVKEWEQEFKQKWFQEGMQKGMQKGAQAGVQQILLRLLHKKFSHIPDPIIQRINKADEAQLMQWSERLLGADTLAAIFEE